MVSSNKISISVSADFCVFAVLSIFILPLQWLIAIFLAAAIHELSHCAVLLLFRKKIISLSLTASGAIIKTETLTLCQELFSALAGPLSIIFLLPFSHIIPRICFCTLLQSVFNLMPIYPMDGGRALMAVLRIIFKDTIADLIYKIVTYFVYAILILSMFRYNIRTSIGIVPVIFAAVFIARNIKLNIPCKVSRQIVQ